MIALWCVLCSIFMSCGVSLIVINFPVIGYVCILVGLILLWFAHHSATSLEERVRELERTTSSKSTNIQWQQASK